MHLSENLKTLYKDLNEDEKLFDNTPDYVRLILRSSVYEAVEGTPVTHCVGLSSALGASVHLKREDLLPVFSFKIRGAYNMLKKIVEKYEKFTQPSKFKGVIAFSAGNHAQGVALAAKMLNIPATIVMPLNTPAIKFDNVCRLGARVVLHGDDVDEAKVECNRICAEEQLTFVPPFDHPYIIAGQGTAAMEILRQVPETDQKIGAVFVPVGGGGLIAGISAYLKRVAPHIKIIGVETYDAPTLKNSLQAGKRVSLKTVGAFADGTAVRVIGEENFRICQAYVDEVVLVSTDELCAAIKDIFNDTRSVVEPSGALGVAGMKKYISKLYPNVDHSNKLYIPVVSGANMNFDRLRFVSERAIYGEGKEVFLLVTVPDTPGTFKALQNLMGDRNVTEFSYRYNDYHKDPVTQVTRACIYISFSCKDKERESITVIEELKKVGFEAVDISNNEMAKTHGRYLAGGVSNVSNEVFFTFEFPERPGALTKFLNQISSSWNLTLFHYRNVGDDIGKVLVGVSVPPEESELFQEFINNLGFPYRDETNNLIIRTFLKSLL